jgi:demethylmenaquinone methyltransferase/2-methoxy-6-polyprenyl-1,4-benzoquinol methylase
MMPSERSGREPAPPEGSGRTGNPVAESDVRDMFDSIAPVYDRLNTLMTLGRDGAWRRAAVRAARVASGDSVIDVACGTGRLSALLAEQVGPFGHVTGVDLSERMIGRARDEHRDVVQLEFVVGNALALAFPDDAFDAATVAFGLRNLADFEAGFRELGRVVRPGGHIVCLELTMPRPRLWGRMFHLGFRTVAPLLGRVFRVGDAYRYLPASVEGFPDAEHLAATMRAAGLQSVRFRRLGLGSVALHSGRVPR